jgi:hypothetical protein
MRTISFDKEALRITIRNLCPGLELISPLYCSNSTTCHVSPSQQTNIGTKVKASFRRDSQKEGLEGVLLYKLRRKYVNRTSNWFNKSAVSVENTEKSIYLLIVWNVKDYHHEFCVYLIECANDFTWDEDKLWTLCYQLNTGFLQSQYQFYENYKSNMITWLMHDGTTVKTRRNVTFGSDYKLEIFISEETGKCNTKNPIPINPKRLVLLFIDIDYTNACC